MKWSHGGGRIFRAFADSGMLWWGYPMISVMRKVPGGLGALAASILVTACGSSVPAPNLTDRVTTRADSDRLVLVLGDLHLPAGYSYRAILHSGDERSIVRDIDLATTDGVADFGPVSGASTVSLVLRSPWDSYWVWTLAGVVPGEYRYLDDPWRYYRCDKEVKVDITVDASGGFDRTATVGVYGYSSGWRTHSSSTDLTVEEFPGMRACAGNPGRILAFTKDSSEPELSEDSSNPALYKLMEGEALVDGGAYRIEPDTQPEAIPFAGSDSNWLDAALYTYVNGHYFGIVDVLKPDALMQRFLGPFSIPGVAVQSVGYALSGNEKTILVRRNALEPPPDSIPKIQFWNVDLETGEFDAQRYTLPYSYTSNRPVDYAEMIVSVQDQRGSWSSWQIFKPATGSEFAPPTMPEDVARAFKLNEQTHNASVYFSLADFDEFDGIAGWSRWYLTSAQPESQKPAGYAYPGTADDALCTPWIPMPPDGQRFKACPGVPQMPDSSGEEEDRPRGFAQARAEPPPGGKPVARFGAAKLDR